MDLASYRPLGCSGLLVSPLALGTMTFGNTSWGSTEDEAAALFDGYTEAGGLLTGKYRRDDRDAGRLGGANPFGDTKFAPANWDTLDVLRNVADEAGASPAQAALAWTLARASRPSSSGRARRSSSPAT